MRYMTSYSSYTRSLPSTFVRAKATTGTVGSFTTQKCPAYGSSSFFVYSSFKSSDLNVSPYPKSLWHTCLFKAVSQALGCAHQVLQDQGVAHSAQTDELQTASKIQVSLRCWQLTQAISWCRCRWSWSAHVVVGSCHLGCIAREVDGHGGLRLSQIAGGQNLDRRTPHNLKRRI